MSAVARGLVLILAAAGCDRVFGLERPPADGAIDAAPTFTVIARVGVDVVVPAGATFARTTEPVSTPITVVLDDGSRPVVSQVDDHFEFQRAREDQSYRFVFTAPLQDVPLTYVGAAAELTLISPLFGRVDRGTVPSGTRINATSSVSLSTAYAFTTGLRTQTLVNESPGSHSGFRIDWTSTTTRSLSGPKGIANAAEGDALHHVTFNVVPGAGFYIIGSVASTPLTMTPGGQTTVMMPPPTSPPHTCIDLLAKRKGETDRITAALGPTTGMRPVWAIESTPLPDLTPLGGIPLTFEDTTGSIDVQRRATFPMPFPGEGIVARLEVTGTISIGQSVSTSFDTLAYARVPTGNCTTPPMLVVDNPAAFATDVTIDGQPLTAPVAVGEGRVAFATRDGAADYFVVDVSEVGVARPRATYVVTAPEVVLDPGLLQSGRRYFLRILTLSGYPGVGVGDFRTLTYPTGRTTTPTAVFQVQ